MYSIDIFDIIGPLFVIVIMVIGVIYVIYRIKLLRTIWKRLEKSLNGYGDCPQP